MQLEFPYPANKQYSTGFGKADLFPSQFSADYVWATNDAHSDTIFVVRLVVGGKGRN